MTTPVVPGDMDARNASAVFYVQLAMPYLDWLMMTLTSFTPLLFT
jgi:hypothetical protein